MNNDTLKIVARLDIPKSVVFIEKDIYKLEEKLKSNNLQILAELNIEKSKDIIKSQLDLISSQTKAPVIKVGIDINKNFEKNTVNGLQNIDKQTKQTTHSIKQVESELSKLDSDSIKKTTFNIGFNKDGTLDLSEIDKTIKKLEKMSNTPVFKFNSNKSEVINQREQISNLINEFSILKKSLQENITPTELNKIISRFKELDIEVNNVFNSNKLLQNNLRQDNSIDKRSQKISILINQIKAFRNINSKAEKQYGNEFNSMLSELGKGTSYIDEEALDRIRSQFQSIRNEVIVTNKTGKTFFEDLWRQAKKFGSWMTLTSIIAGTWRDLQKMVTEVVELDSAMSNLKKVTDATETSYSKFLKNSIQQARDLKMDLSDLINQSAEWAKKGYNLDQSSKLSQASGIYSVVGEVDNATAVQDLTTVMKSYNMTVEDSMDIVDKFNNISNRYGVTAGDIGEILSNSISSLRIAGNSLDEAIAMGTTIAEITGDASEAGNTVKVLSMRLRGASTEIEQMGESTDGMAESTSKLQSKIKALTNVNGKGGFDIMTDADSFKSTYDIINGISTVWKDMSDIDQAALIELIAGKQRGNTVSTLLTNMSQAGNVLADSLNSSGSAMKEYSVYLNSLSGKIQGIKTEFSALSQTFIDDDSLKGTLDIATSFLQVLTKIIDKLGLVKTLGLSIATVLSFKNVGEPNTPAYVLPHLRYIG